MTLELMDWLLESHPILATKVMLIMVATQKMLNCKLVIQPEGQLYIEIESTRKMKISIFAAA